MITIIIIALFTGCATLSARRMASEPKNPPLTLNPSPFTPIVRFWISKLHMALFGKLHLLQPVASPGQKHGKNHPGGHIAAKPHNYPQQILPG